MENKKTAENVSAVKQDMKIIVMVRNPIDRAYSQYHRSIKDNMESREFEDLAATLTAVTQSTEASKASFDLIEKLYPKIVFDQIRKNDILEIGFDNLKIKIIKKFTNKILFKTL